jgi:2-C-methyl-D-erythritol 4-phosphate cytidylyltransferase
VRASDDGVWTVVLAAGVGSRFGGAKQFEDLGGMRLVDRAVTNATQVCGRAVVVLPDGVTWDGPPVDAAVSGGATRADSVRAGLAAVPMDAEVIVIHDAAHPLATPTIFQAVIGHVLDGYDGAVPVVPLRETIMRVAADLVIDVVPREGLHAIQMPHAFAATALRGAHESGIEATDDASLLVAAGYRIATVAGDPFNVHVTTPDELELARRLVAAQDERTRERTDRRPGLAR